jgi:hypothetical protein
MKKNLRVTVLSLAVAISFSTCTKIGVRWPHGHDNPIIEREICRITKIRQAQTDRDPARTGVFYYSDKGNLDSVVFDMQGLVHYWRYDLTNRLLEYRETYNHDLSQFKTLHRYASVGDKVVRDTTWLEGASGYIIQVWTLEYDNKGRVVRETGIRIDDEAYGAVLPVRTYRYDKDGNLQDADYDHQYDEEINYLRTNKVLQFVHRNYSMNNIVNFVFGYNSYGLPLVHRFTVPGQFLGWGHPLEIWYSCLPIPGAGGYKDGCRFATMKQLINNNLYRDGTFYYTPDGRPMSVLFQDPDRIQTSTHHFVYNKQERLTTYYSAVGLAYDEYHAYGYANGKITVDTMYKQFGDEFTQISKLSYDTIGRIIKEDIHVIERFGSPVSEFKTVSYQYNANGNLVSPLITAYDNKVNYLRVNPIWMFIHRNYSRNNPQGVTNYNSKGLPLGFSNKVFGFLGWSEPSELTYACEENSKNNK